jgi:hypothetical protein
MKKLMLVSCASAGTPKIARPIAITEIILALVIMKFLPSCTLPAFENEF